VGPEVVMAGDSSTQAIIRVKDREHVPPLDGVEVELQGEMQEAGVGTRYQGSRGVSRCSSGIKQAEAGNAPGRGRQRARQPACKAG